MRHISLHFIYLVQVTCGFPKHGENKDGALPETTKGGKEASDTKLKDVKENEIKKEKGKYGNNDLKLYLKQRIIMIRLNS